MKVEVCFIVVHRNYAEGVDAYAFYDKTDAETAVSEEVATEVRSLKEQGYELIAMTKNATGGAEVYVPDTNIYYEWEIIVSGIR